MTNEVRFPSLGPSTNPSVVTFNKGQIVSIYWVEEAAMAAILRRRSWRSGDSWFWYPFPGGSLASYLGPLVDSKPHVILAEGMNGAEAFDYVDGKVRNSVNQALRIYGSGLFAVFINGSGNDFAGFNDMAPLLNLDCSGAQSAIDCSRSGDGGLQAGPFFERMGCRKHG